MGDSVSGCIYRYGGLGRRVWIEVGYIGEVDICLVWRVFSLSVESIVTMYR